MRRFVVVTALLPAVVGTLPAWAKDCPVRPRADTGAASFPGCPPDAARPLREDAMEAQQPGERRDGTSIQLGGRVRGEAFGQSRGR